MDASRVVCIGEGVRTPFLRSFTGFRTATPYQLLRQCFINLAKNSKIPQKEVDYICAGNVMQNANTTNVARDALIGAGFPLNSTADTISMACISSNAAITSCWEKIKIGRSNVAIGSGVEVMSDPPIKYAKSLRQAISRLKPPSDVYQWAKVALTFANPKIFMPDIPGLVEFTTQESMGYSTERLASRFQVSRTEQDEFAAASQQKAFEAQKSGKLTDVSDITIDYVTHSLDNGIRKSDVEKLRTLPPAFHKPNGSLTAGNSSFITDGASSTLLIAEDKAKELGIKPKGILIDSVFAACDPTDELLLGPAYAISKILAKHNLSLDEIDVFEIHEAFAGQILSVIKALDCQDFCTKKLNRNAKVGLIPPEKLNLWGGSLALGHPLAATGSRLVNMAVNRLKVENKRLALVSACAAGAQANAMLIENYEAAERASKPNARQNNSQQKNK